LQDRKRRPQATDLGFGCGGVGPGQELVESALRVPLDDAGDHVCQVGEGLDLVELAGLDEGRDGGQCWAPPSDPANSAFLRVSAMGRIVRSTALESISIRPSSRNRPSPCQRASGYRARRGMGRGLRQPRTPVAHPSCAAKPKPFFTRPFPSERAPTGRHCVARHAPHSRPLPSGRERAPVLAAEPAGPGQPTSAFPKPDRPVAEIVSPRWAAHEERDRADESDRWRVS
jgi:hypothetical protein